MKVYLSLLAAVLGLSALADLPPGLCGQAREDLRVCVRATERDPNAVTLELRRPDGRASIVMPAGLQLVPLSSFEIWYLGRAELDGKRQDVALHAWQDSAQWFGRLWSRAGGEAWTIASDPFWLGTAY